MAGGTFVSRNQVRAGAYINFRSRRSGRVSVGERGTAAVALDLHFGPEGLVRVEKDTNIWETFGYRADSAELLPLREAAKFARTVLVYRLAGGGKASGRSGNLTVTAKYGGSRGNEVSVRIQKEGGAFCVETRLDGEKADSQIVSDAAELKENAWVKFSGSGALTPQAGLSLTGGTDLPVGKENWTAFFKALETAEFQTFAVTSDDIAVKAAACEFVRRMREEEGVKIQGVLAAYPQADYEGIISVKNGVVLEDGTVVSKEIAAAAAAGMTAGAQVNQSNTYAVYRGAADVTERYTHSEIVAALRGGEWLFVPQNGKVAVEQDLNSFTSFRAEKGEAFSKNRLLRVMDAIANDVRELFSRRYLGKTGNSADGRSLFRAELAGYFSGMEEIGAIDGFDSREDIAVLPGETADAVIVELAVRPVDSMEKLYLTVEL